MHMHCDLYSFFLQKLLGYCLLDYVLKWSLIEYMVE